MGNGSQGCRRGKKGGNRFDRGCVRGEMAGNGNQDCMRGKKAGNGTGGT